MRLTCWLFGHEVFALDIGAGDEASEDDPLRDLGALGSTPMGFTHWPVPEEITAPQHCPSWDEPEESR